MIRPNRIPWQRRSALTLIETLVTVIIISMLLLVLHHLLRSARREIRKGLWLQATINDLRNTTYGLSRRLKRATYPTTVAGNQVIAYKEWREFDSVGRLRTLKVADGSDPAIPAKTGMDLEFFVPTPGILTPNNGTQRLLIFPMCTPEIETQRGTITWVELWLEKQPFQMANEPRSQLRMIEYSDSYQTTGGRRVFDLNKTFSPTLPVISNKVVVRDIKELEFDSFAVNELRGIAVSTTGDRAVKTRKRFLVTIIIRCAHPQDNKTTIIDNCSVVNHIDVVAVSGGMLLVVKSTSPPNTALVTYLGSDQTISVGNTVNNAFTPVEITANSVKVRMEPDGIERTFYLGVGPP